MWIPKYCAGCPYQGKRVVPPQPSKVHPPKLIVVGQSPGAEEEAQGQPFVGPSGKLLWQALSVIGVSRDDVYVTNVVKCRPCDDRGRDVEPPAEVVQRCVRHLKEELTLFDSNVPILCCGKIALKGVSDMSNFRMDEYVGSVIEVAGRKVFTIWHPAHILRSGSTWMTYHLYNELLPKLRDLINNRLEQTTLPQHKVKLYDHTMLDSLLHTHLQGKPYVALDIETRDVHIEEPLLTLALYDGEFAHVVFNTCDDIEVWRKFLSQLPPVIVHNGEFDISHLLYKYGPDIPLTIKHDTLVLQHVLDEEKEKSLSTLAKLYLNAPPYKSVDWKEVRKRWDKHRPKSVEEVDRWWFEFAYYNACDAFYTYKIAHILDEALSTDEPSKHFYYHVMLPLLNATIYVRIYGVPISLEKLEEIERELTQELQQMESDIKRTWNIENVRSNQELERVFTLLGLTKEETGTTDTGRMKLDKYVLADLSLREDKVGELARTVLEYKKKSHILRSYVHQMKRYIFINKHTNVPSVAPSFKLHASVTYRINTEEPNVHNIPRDSIVKKVVAAPPGYLILGYDYVSAEAYHAAVLSGEELIIKFVLDPNLDQHRYTASKVFGVPEEEVTKEMRTNAKLAWFCLQYGGTEHALMRDFGFSLDYAVKIVKGIKATYPKLFGFMDMIAQVAALNRKLVNRFGATRRFHIWTHDSERQAKNFPFQSEVAIYTHLAFIDLCEISRSFGIPHIYRPLFSIHDAIYALVKEEWWPLFAVIQQKVMEMERYGMSLLVDPKVGPTWYDLEDVKEEDVKEWKDKSLEELLQVVSTIVK